MTDHDASPGDAQATIGAQLLDVIVQLNRWVNHRSVWTLPLTLAQARILSQIDALGTPCVSDLAQAERCTLPTMTAQLRRLQAPGLIARDPDPRDGRVARVSLTAAGQQALAQARRARAAIAESLIAQLDAAGRQNLQDALDTLSRLLDAAYHPPVNQKESSKS